MFPEVPELDSDALKAFRKWEAKQAAEKAEQTKRERAEARVRQQELAQWRAVQYSGCFYASPPMLRIAGDEVQTSPGARFPEWLFGGVTPTLLYEAGLPV